MTRWSKEGFTAVEISCMIYNDRYKSLHVYLNPQKVKQEQTEIGLQPFKARLVHMGFKQTEEYM